MIETICEACGNRKEFSDSFEGKAFKCVRCSNPVKIERLVSQINLEPVAVNNDLSAEIEKAELLAAKKKEQAVIEIRKKRSKKYLFWGIYLVIAGIMGLPAGGGGVVLIGIAVYLFVKRNGILKGKYDEPA